MKVTITPSRLSGTVQIPESKSHAHRLLIATALSRSKDFNVALRTPSEDLLATRDVLSVLLANQSSPGTNILLDCRESGSTLRFLLPVAMALCPKDTAVEFCGSGRLPNRPLSPLWEQMEAHGCRLERDDKLICKAFGPLSGGDFFLPGDVSSQYVTGLLFALPLTKEGGIIHLTSPLESAAYVDLTLAVLRQFGIDVTWEAPAEGTLLGRFLVPGDQVYVAPSPSVVPEGDWSAAAFWLVANALGSDVQIDGLSNESIQGDRAILPLLEQLGALPRKSFSSQPLTIDVRQIPDLVPILAVLLSVIPGQHRIVGAARLRIKESDRLAAIADELSVLGARVTEEEDGLLFQNDHQEGSPFPSSLQGGATVSGHNDHRIVMALAIAATICKEKITITQAQAVTKSYPRFWEDYQALGGTIALSE